MFDRFAGGESISSITRWLTLVQHEIPRIGKGDWHHQHVRRILTNPKYIGTWSFGKTTTVRDSVGNKKQVAARADQKVVTVPRPRLRIVEQKVWEKAQEKLAQLMKVYGMKAGDKRRGPAEHYRLLYPKSLLGGLIYCAQCGSRMIRGSAGGIKRLACPKHRAGTCGMTARVPYARAEERVLELFQQILTCYPDWMAAVVTEARSPYRWHTKADVLRTIDRHGATDLLTSSVSCSATFRHGELGRQCGKCFQCIERRLAAYAAGLGDIDSSGTYAFDFIRDSIDSVEAKSFIVDYLRLAWQFGQNGEAWFAKEKIDELADLVDFVEGRDDTERTSKIRELCRRHGTETFRGIRHIRERYDDPARLPASNTLLEIVNVREYLKEPVEKLIADMRTRFQDAIPIAFRSRRPRHENELNDQIQAILAAERDRFEREFPVIRFGTAKTVPDHSAVGLDVFVEAKLVRKGTPQAKLTDELAADTVKYGKHRRILFVMYDPDRAIASDRTFAQPFEQDGRCGVCFVR